MVLARYTITGNILNAVEDFADNVCGIRQTLSGIFASIGQLRKPCNALCVIEEKEGDRFILAFN